MPCRRWDRPRPGRHRPQLGHRDQAAGDARRL